MATILNKWQKRFSKNENPVFRKYSGIFELSLYNFQKYCFGVLRNMFVLKKLNYVHLFSRYSAYREFLNKWVLIIKLVRYVQFFWPKNFPFFTLPAS